MVRQDEQPRGVIAGITRYFLSGPASVIFLVAASIMGMVALLGTPQEEEPQIVVPMADVFVDAPGLSPAEVEEQVTRPLERILWQVRGVEHVYSISRRGASVVTVRFHVGEDREKALVNLRDQIESHRDIVPPAVRGWVVKPVQIDDVPIVLLTFYSPVRPVDDVRRIVEEAKARLDSLGGISRSELYGGQRREVTVEPDIEAMASRGVCMADIVRALQGGEPGGDAGEVVQDGRLLTLRPGTALRTAGEVRDTVIRSPQGRTVRVADVAAVHDSPQEPVNYHHITFGPADAQTGVARGVRMPAVTLAFAKKKGTDAINVAASVLERAEALRGTVVPDDLLMRVTRNYGVTARDKVNNLLSSMAFAILTVVALLAVTMGWRESVVVGLAVPISFALALFVNYIAGYTINRVTLFALILSLGLVVDDPITNVDNIQRHIRMGVRTPFLAAQWAVKELLVPVIMSTLTIIASFLPMFFITGMMGPYMRPMAVNVPLAVSFSTVCAVTFVPWLAYRLLKHRAAEATAENVTPGWVRRGYRAVLGPFLERRRGRLLLAGVAALFLASGLLVLFGKVPLKMLPFDNKDELQLVVDLPEGTPLEQTDRVCQELEAYLATVNEVKDFETYTGINSPIDFNGLVRHYAFRRMPNQAEIRINFEGRNRRAQQSHDIGLRLRNDLTRIAGRHDAKLSIVEVPPGPPVLSTITAEVYGGPEAEYEWLIEGAKELEQRMAKADPVHIAQIDDMAETPRPVLDIMVDRDKAARHGLAPADITRALQTATLGAVPGALHAAHERDPLLVRVRLPYTDRVRPERLEQLWLRTGSGGQVQLGELAVMTNLPADQPIYRKDLERVVFVTAESVGRPPGEVVLQMQRLLRKDPLPHGVRVAWAGEGEWQVTVDVFRDLGIAFGVALIGIYLLLVFQTGSFSLPGIMMLAIPLTAIGILPGFWLLNVLAGRTIGGYPTPVFFTATAMIGMIALGGIVIRNSSVLIEFVHQALAEGMPLRDALLDSGAVRFRPIALTALTTLLGVWPITLDPIFSGLAWSLIFGLLASTVFTLLVIPTVYYLLYAQRQQPSHA
ncbi:efflux RND transporter permease subunit [bacterium]|nr:efflux RND transporter permease subunit [bacterium]